MWSLILYFLFGIGQPSNPQPNPEHPTVQTFDEGGDTSSPRPPIPPKPTQP